MTEAVKIEIIYYRAEHDAALEFGLSGDAALRVRTGKAVTPAELPPALKRATFRSEFIAVVGNFEKDGTLGLLAKAIGRSEVSASSAAPEGSDVKGDIIEGSVPLIAGGELCGMVAESNYQSLIVLSGEKRRRDLVLGPLVMPYINERCAEIYDMRRRLYTGRSYKKSELSETDGSNLREQPANAGGKSYPLRVYRKSVVVPEPPAGVGKTKTPGKDKVGGSAAESAGSRLDAGAGASDVEAETNVMFSDSGDPWESSWPVIFDDDDD